MTRGAALTTRGAAITAGVCAAWDLLVVVLLVVSHQYNDASTVACVGACGLYAGVWLGENHGKDGRS